MDALTDLVQTWRSDAEKLRLYGDDRGAKVVDSLTSQLEAAIQETGQGLLNLTAAARVSGYSKRRLRELVAEGKLENAGETGRPRFRRADLPMKPGRDARTTRDGYDPAADARSIAGRIGR